MADFVVSSEMLRGKADNIRAQKGKFEELTDNITQQLTSLSSTWSGDAFETFKSNFDALKPSFERYAGVIEEYAAFLVTAAEGYEKAEDHAKSTTSELESKLF